MAKKEKIKKPKPLTKLEIHRNTLKNRQDHVMMQVLQMNKEHQALSVSIELIEKKIIKEKKNEKTKKRKTKSKKKL